MSFLSPLFLAQTALNRYQRWQDTRQQTGAPEQRLKFFLREVCQTFQASPEERQRAERILNDLLPEPASRSLASE